MLDVADSHRIHVMNIETLVDLIPLNPEIATVVSSNHLVPNTSPFTGSVELLIHVTIETESDLSDLSSQSKICVTIFERA